MGSVLAIFGVALAASLGAGTAETPPEEHCVVTVIGQEADGQFITSEPVCFEKEPDAENWAAGLPAPSLNTDSDEARSTSGPTTLSSFTLGRHYDGANGSGSSIRIVGSSCGGGYWNTGANWANRISSSYNGCARLRHWDLPNRGGSSEDTFGAGTTDNLGFMNNNAESVSYHSS